MLMLLSSGTGDSTLGTTGFEDEAESGKPVRELWWLQARQNQSLKQGRALGHGDQGQREERRAERRF